MTGVTIAGTDLLLISDGGTEGKVTFDQVATFVQTTSDTDDISEGGEMYTRYCMQCHNLGNGGGTIPDLTYSTETVFNMYENILLDGVFLPKGMPSFEDRLNKKDVEKIKDYVLYTASTLEP